MSSQKCFTETPAKPRGEIYDSILSTVGGTPLVRMPKLTEEENLEAEVLAKLEFFNPLASVKDRIAFSMIQGAEDAGKITPGKTTLIEPTSGNTGVGLAFIAAAKGYRIILTMPESMSIERRKMLAFMGAKVVLTDKQYGMKGAIAKAEELMRETPDSFCPSQFDNPDNPRIHRETTAEEIWQDTEGKADILVAGVATGGTFSGCAGVLKERKPEFRAIAVEPEETPVLSGGEPGLHKIQGIGPGFIAENTDTSLIDEIIKVNADTAFKTSQRIARLEGIPCGISAGAAITATIQVAKRPENKGKMIVAIIPSFAERYLSTPLFEGLDNQTW